MAKTVYLKYTIYLTDAAQVAALQGTAGPGGAVGAVIMAPTVAAATYSAPIEEESAPFVAPCVRSEWFKSGNNFPRDQRTFDRKSGGWFGISALFGTTTHYYWRGVFALSADPVLSPVIGEAKVAMARRRLICGFELPDTGEGGIPSQSTAKCARAASRHVDGYGLYLDSSTNVATAVHTLMGAAAASDGWDRFYVRIQRLPTAPMKLWCTSGTAVNGAGVRIYLLPSGQLQIDNVIGGGPTVNTIMTTPASRAVHTWYKFDCLYRYGAAARFELWINGLLEVSLAAASFLGGGLGTAGNVTSTALGSDVANTGILNYDDWIISDIPTQGGVDVLSKPGLDWNYGSRVVRIAPTGFAASHDAVAWPLNWRLLAQRPANANNFVTQTSSTALGRMAVTTDAALEVDAVPGGLGIAALQMAVYVQRNSINAAQMGFKLPGQAEVLVNTVANASIGWQGTMYRPNGVVDPLKPIAGLELAYVHSNAAEVNLVGALQAIAEIVGVFGPEDGVLEAPASIAATVWDGGDSPLDSSTVAAVKADLVARGVDLSGSDGAFAITLRVAWATRHNGGGLLSKTGGNVGTFNGLTYSTDNICLIDGSIFDILSDGGGANGPQWNANGTVAATLYRAAVDPGDTLPTGAMARPIGIHNAPYPRTPWAHKGAAPISPVIVHAGTYVGNGTFQDLTFRAPVHFLLVRPVGLANGPNLWFSSMNAAHYAGNDGWAPAGLVQALYESAGAAAEDQQEEKCTLRIYGSANESNANAQTYQYLAIEDPGMRFLECGAVDAMVSTTSYVHHLSNEGFTPEALWLWNEINGISAVAGGYFKGLGGAADSINRLANTEVATALSFARGTFTVKSGISIATHVQRPFAAFRRDDGSGDPGVPRVLQLATYTGDGSASRTISLAPASGRRPLWGLVSSHGAAAVYRDPSHTTVTSTTFPNTANASTGITGGGIDSISVGSALNSNGVVYEVFVLPGDTVAGNNGWSINGEFAPVEPATPTGFVWDIEPADPELQPDAPADEPVPEEGGDDTDFGDQCVAASTKIINQALSRIGVSKRVVDIVLEQSEEAACARLHFSDDLSATLRDFDWPFATRYADLVLVAGTASVPVNRDWQYAYRAPINMMKARRIVNPAFEGYGRDYDPAPPKFRIGSDAEGQLIYTNETDPQLEYTIRPSCAASSADAIFRSALTWRHAHSLAPVLSKDEKKVAFCWQMYKALLNEAKVPAAQEQQQAIGGDPDWITGRN